VLSADAHVVGVQQLSASLQRHYANRGQTDDDPWHLLVYLVGTFSCRRVQDMIRVPGELVQYDPKYRQHSTLCGARVYAPCTTETIGPYMSGKVAFPIARYCSFFIGTLAACRSALHCDPNIALPAATASREFR
jgi:hypothetical protein